jgi:hypothetical protein
MNMATSRGTALKYSLLQTKMRKDGRRLREVREKNQKRKNNKNQRSKTLQDQKPRKARQKPPKKQELENKTRRPPWTSNHDLIS